MKQPVVERSKNRPEKLNDEIAGHQVLLYGLIMACLVF
jgi:hypothetical protein